MDNIVITDDDRQTSSNDQSSSDDISSVATETLLPVYEDDQRQISSTNSIPVCPVKVNNSSSLPNIKIEYSSQSEDDDGNNPFNDEKRIIIDEHVKVSHIDRSSLDRINKDISLLKSDASSSQKPISNVRVSRINHINSQSINGNLNNRQITQMTSRQSTVRVIRISTAANINQGSDQKLILSKAMVTRLTISNERSRQMKQKKLQVSEKHGSDDSKKNHHKHYFQIFLI